MRAIPDFRIASVYNANGYCSNITILTPIKIPPGNPSKISRTRRRYIHFLIRLIYAWYDSEKNDRMKQEALTSDQRFPIRIHNSTKMINNLWFENAWFGWKIKYIYNVYIYLALPFLKVIKFLLSNHIGSIICWAYYYVSTVLKYVMWKSCGS